MLNIRFVCRKTIMPTSLVSGHNHACAQYVKHMKVKCYIPIYRWRERYEREWQ